MTITTTVTISIQIERVFDLSPQQIQECKALTPVQLATVFNMPSTKNWATKILSCTLTPEESPSTPPFDPKSVPDYSRESKDERRMRLRREAWERENE